jgi:hypothetical protein
MTDELHLDAAQTKALRHWFEDLGFELSQASRGLDPENECDDFTLRPIQRARVHFNSVLRVIDRDSDFQFTDREMGLPGAEVEDYSIRL